MRGHRSLAVAGFLLVASAAPLSAQLQEWQNQWYWGAKGGLIRYTMPSGTVTVTHPQAGGEWLITARRSALYVAYSTSFTRELDPSATIQGATIPVLFDALQRIQISLLVFPWGGNLQPYIGGGFQIETLSNAKPDCTGLTTAQCSAATNYLGQHSSGGFALVMGGAQLRIGKLAIYGQAQLSPQGKDFLLPNSSQSLEFGVRYAFLGSREEDVTTRR